MVFDVGGGEGRLQCGWCLVLVAVETKIMKERTKTLVKVPNKVDARIRIF